MTGFETARLGPNVAGTWYARDGNELKREIDALLEGKSAEPAAPADSVLALIAPHAGLMYSGAVAASGFRLLRARAFERVILIGPSHYAAFKGAALPRAGLYSTPLGDVPLDTDSIAALQGRPATRIDDGPFIREHSLEAEIPFLQRALPAGWKLLPVLIGAHTTPQDAQLVADALAPRLGPSSLLVVSSDFTHYGAGFDYVPFRDDVQNRIRRLDMGAVKLILGRNARGFADYVGKTGATICGRNAIDVLLRLLPDDAEGALLDYDTSGRMTSTWDHSVSYASLLFRAPAASDTVSQ